MPTKLKNKKVLKAWAVISAPSQNGLEKLLPNKRASTSFPQSKKVKCFQCQQSFEIKYLAPRFTYSKKNDWYHWTDKPENQGKQICDACLWKFYHSRKVYWETIADLKKRMKLTTYIHKGIIANK